MITAALLAGQGPDVLRGTPLDGSTRDTVILLHDLSFPSSLWLQTDECLAGPTKDVSVPSRYGRRRNLVSLWAGKPSPPTE